MRLHQKMRDLREDIGMHAVGDPNRAQKQLDDLDRELEELLPGIASYWGEDDINQARKRLVEEAALYPDRGDAASRERTYGPKGSTRRDAVRGWNKMVDREIEKARSEGEGTEGTEGTEEKPNPKPE